MAAEKKEDKYNVPSLEKALDVLEYLSRASAPLPLSAIAKDLDKTSSEVFRVVNCLVKRNYLVKDATVNAYSLSLKFFELTNNVPPLKRLVDASVLPLAELAREIHYSCHLSVLEDGDLVVLYEQEGMDAIHIHVKAGYRAPAHRTTSGKLLLAQLDEAGRDTALRHDPGFRSMAPETQGVLLEELRGLAGFDGIVRPSNLHSGIVDVVSVFPIYRYRYAALAVPVFQHDSGTASTDLIRRELRRAAERIRAAVGS